MPRQPGVKGATPPRRRRHSCEEPWYTTDVPFVEPALRTPSHHTASLCNPRGLRGGIRHLRSALDTISFQTSSRRLGLRRAKRLPPVIPLTQGYPWTPAMISGERFCRLPHHPPPIRLRQSATPTSALQTPGPASHTHQTASAPKHPPTAKQSAAAGKHSPFRPIDRHLDLPVRRRASISTSTASTLAPQPATAVPPPGPTATPTP